MDPCGAAGSENSLVEQRHARHVDIVEIAGSNPAGTILTCKPRGEALRTPRVRRKTRGVRKASPRGLNDHTPVAQRQRHLSHTEAIAGSSPAGSTYCGVDWNGTSTVS